MQRLRFHLALIAAKCSIILIKMLGRNASHNPGAIALKICPKFMELAPKAPKVICVTGTNGKTTVANLLTDALVSDGKKVVSNRLGSNIVPGCTTNLINSLNMWGKCVVDATVYEVDERASRLILPYLKPDFLVVNNLFRDSLKRNGHPDYIFNILNTYCPDDTKLILNADELCSSQLKPNNDRVFFGIGKQETDLTKSINLIADYSFCPECGEVLDYDYLRYHHIGYAKCNKCGFHSHDADYLATTIDRENNTLTVMVNGEEQKYPLISDITFNIYNELSVISTLLELGYSYEDAYKLVSQIKVPDSRFNQDEINGVPVIQVLSKGQNSVSSSRAFDYVSEEKGNKVVILAMDDRHDRKKSVEYIGWIYDVDYEFFKRDGIKQIIAAGPRCYDHKVRLLLAGVDESIIHTCFEEVDSVDLIKWEEIDSVYILYDVYTYDLSCQIKEKVIKHLEGAK